MIINKRLLMTVTHNIKNAFVHYTAAFTIFLFVYTGVSKAFSLQNFRLVFLALHFSPLLSGFLSIALPVLELLIAATLFLPATRQYGLAAATILMSVFTAYIGGMLLFASRLPCSCGGVLASLGWKSHFIFNIAITVITCIAWRLCPKQSNHPKIVLQYPGAAENL